MASVVADYKEQCDYNVKDEPDGDDTTQGNKDAVWRCGEVMYGRDNTFILVCALCLQQYKGWRSFVSHIREKHVPFELNNEMTDVVDSLKPFSTIPFTDNNSRTGVEINQWEQVEVIVDIPAESAEGDSTTDELDVATLPGHQEENSNEDKATAVNKTTQREKSYTKELCVHCSRSYMDKTSLMAHMRRMHNEQMSFSPMAAEAKPMPKQKKNESEITTCKYCNLQCDSPSALKEHRQIHTGSHRFLCPYCPKLSRSAFSRQAHVNTHTGERPFKCKLCPKSFADTRNLSTHVRSHLKIKNFECIHCGRRFVQSAERIIHERTHTGERPYQCEECGQRFISQVRLTDHGKRHKNIRNYKCEVCHKTFFVLAQLKDHRTMHSDARPFQCKICGRDFSRRKALQSHEKLHSDIKGYVCVTCGKAFAQHAALYSHRKSHGERLG